MVKTKMKKRKKPVKNAMRPFPTAHIALIAFSLFLILSRLSSLHEDLNS